MAKQRARARSLAGSDRRAPAVEPAATPSDLRGEPWAEEQRRRGEPIRFPADWPEADREVSGRFVLDLLLDPQAGEIVLTDAIVTTPIDRAYAQIRGAVHFANCVFRSPVSLPLATFERRARFLGCTFDAAVDLTACSATYLWFSPTEDGRVTTFRHLLELLESRITGQLICRKTEFLGADRAVSFNSIRVSGAALFSESSFHGPVSFQDAKIAGALDLTGVTARSDFALDGAEIGGSLGCSGVQFLGPDAAATLTGIWVKGDTSFKDAVFNGRVDFSSAQLNGMLACEKTRFTKGPVRFNRITIGADLTLVNAEFSDPEQQVSFNGARVNGHSFLRGSSFAGPVDFTGAELGGVLECQGTKFQSSKVAVDFAAVRVKGYTTLAEAEFKGSVNFAFAELDSLLVCTKAQFLSEEGQVSFQGARIGKDALFDDAAFAGSVIFNQAVIGSSLNCDRARFLSKEQAASFARLRVPDGFFRNASFSGPVMFLVAEFSGLLNCDGARFLADDKPASLYGVKVGKIATFQGVVFSGGADFGRAEFEGDLNCSAARFAGKQPVRFELVTVKGNCMFPKAEFGGPLNFAGAALGNYMQFDEAVFCDEARFDAVRNDGQANFTQACFKGTASFIGFSSRRFLLFNLAVFENKADLSLSRIGETAQFMGATFKGPVQLNFSHFSGAVECTPMAGPGGASTPTVFEDTFGFRACEVKGDLRFDQASFRKTGQFAQSRVGGAADFSGAAFGGDADFSAFSVAGDLRCGRATFKGQVNLQFLSTGGEADFAGMTCEGSMSFKGAKIGRDAYFRSATFTGWADFSACTAEGSMYFNTASDAGKTTFKQGVAFSGCILKEDLCFDRVVCEGDADFALSSMRIGVFESARFGGRIKFFMAQAVTGLVFTEAVANGAADFASVRVGGVAGFRGATFGGSCSFKSARIAGDVFFNRAVFSGDATFTGAVFGANAWFGRSQELDNEAERDGTQFNGSSTFDHSIFEGMAFFLGALFGKPASFARVHFRSRVLWMGVKCQDDSRSSLVFADAEFFGQVLVLRSEFAGRTSLYGAKFTDSLRIKTSCKFQGLLDLENCRLARLIVEEDDDAGSELPFHGGISIAGCTYQRVSVPGPLRSFWTLAAAPLRNELVGKRGEFDQQPYLEFEKYCRRAGNRKLADQVHFERRQAESALETRVLPKLGSALEEATFGYGVRFGRMIGWVAGAFLVGIIVLYWPGAMEFFDKPPAGPWSGLGRRALTSLGNITPGLDHFFAKSWAPSTHSGVAMTAAIAQRCFGWLILGLIGKRFLKRVQGPAA